MIYKGVIAFDDIPTFADAFGLDKKFARLAVEQIFGAIRGTSISCRGGKRCARSRLSPPYLQIVISKAAIPTRSSPPRKTKSTYRSKCSWCDQGDLNPHGCPYAPQTYASACSAMIANDNDYNIGLPEFCQALKGIFLGKYPF